MDLAAFDSRIAILDAILYKLNWGCPTLHFIMYYKSPLGQIRMQKYQEINVWGKIKIG